LGLRGTGRTPIACTNCAKSKTKCDKKFPCNRCESKYLKCTLRPSRRQQRRGGRVWSEDNAADTAYAAKDTDSNESLKGPKCSPDAKSFPGNSAAEPLSQASGLNETYTQLCRMPPSPSRSQPFFPPSQTEYTSLSHPLQQAFSTIKENFDLLSLPVFQTAEFDAAPNWVTSLFSPSQTNINKPYSSTPVSGYEESTIRS
jgi:hypothetical protein